jgi:anti-sigma regulatory factor (Ser/Thr protein kinase)
MVVTGWGLGSLATDCELIASELATNVVAAAADLDGQPRYDAATGRLPTLWLRLMSDGALLRVEIWDDLPAEFGAPTQRQATTNDESGRGLELVDALSLDWGWERLPCSATNNSAANNNAKRVWALLRPGGKDQP